MQPLVSILFPCYNAADFLEYSLSSILQQDYASLEVICINDGSTDATLSILQSFRDKDKRVVIVNNPKNMGLIDSLNASFDYITGEYFARMDADDFSPRDRIASQVSFMISNPQYDLVSSGYNYFRENGVPLEYVPAVATLPNALKFISLFSTPLAHGAVLGRTSLIKRGVYFYDKHFQHAEDFELFSRLTWQNISLTSITHPLYWARLNEGSVSSVYNAAQIRTNQRIIRRNLQEYFGITETISDRLLKIVSSRIDTEISLEELRSAFRLLEQYYMLAQSRLSFSEKEKKEIKRYLSLQKLNMIIQSNKIRFTLSSPGSSIFFLRSLFSLRPGQLPLLLKKLTKPRRRGN